MTSVWEDLHHPNGKRGKPQQHPETDGALPETPGAEGVSLTVTEEAMTFTNSTKEEEKEEQNSLKELPKCKETTARAMS